ncbi:MAG: hypothetical protein QFX33_00395 [Candidatus Nezhaarchaeota archaeon]|nr:hypothetical protein [Candidatus Nezhaarchaeota archaeon]
MSSTTLKVLLDSTYILPSFGIEVEGLSADHIVRLREAGVKGEVKFYCLTVVWIEIIGKICRERERLNKNIDDIIEVSVKSLLESGFYKWLTPTSNAVRIAFKLRMLGHKDNVDNLLYATSLDNDMLLLTMDEELKEFLLKNNFKADNLVDHEGLLKMLVK